ncbi:hypothetical protein QYE76_011702 [Lolium multiflorum]|uniref:Integrase catalytic domain-containing protein n=1 Tax=Lolium multiflorum TaxID=4521 RepID=A0AAD8TVV4_LOLMU|nr:hypothetical protein QYE76_011702 [Lolium multiflorum]
MYESEIKAIRTDNGTEFKNYTMREFVDDEGIKHEFSAPYTPQQNGVVETKNRTIIKMARTMLSEFKSPHKFWGEAISTDVHYSNRLFLHPLHNKTPYELLTGNKPNVMYIRVFGCKSLVKDNRGKLGKFEARNIGVHLLDMRRTPSPIDTTTSPVGLLKYLVTWCSWRIMAPKWSELFHVLQVMMILLTPSSLWAFDISGPRKFILMIKMMEEESQAQHKWSLALLKLNHQVQPKTYLLLKMSHIPKNKKKALNPLSKTMMLIKKHPQPMVELKLSLMIEY